MEKYLIMSYSIGALIQLYMLCFSIQELFEAVRCANFLQIIIGVKRVSNNFSSQLEHSSGRRCVLWKMVRLRHLCTTRDSHYDFRQQVRMQIVQRTKHRPNLTVLYVGKTETGLCITARIRFTRYVINFRFWIKRTRCVCCSWKQGEVRTVQ